MARSEWVSDDVMERILGAMMPANRLAVEVSLATGLRISDVLALDTETVQRTQRPYIRDSKTGKTHRVYIPTRLHGRMLAQAGRWWVWPHRTDAKRHRTRQAVYKDMGMAVEVVKRAGWVDKQAQISPHSARKVAAVRAYKRKGFAGAQQLLVHDAEHPAVTLLYALADQVPPDRRPRSRRRKRRSCAKSTRSPQSGHCKQGSGASISCDLVRQGHPAHRSPI